MEEIKYVTYVKEGRNWVEGYTCNDEKEVYERLAQNLISKKINACTYIKSIKRVNNYDGTQNITISYDNNTKTVYTVADH